MGLLHQALSLRPGDLRKRLDSFLVRPREAGRGAHGESGERARRHQSRLGSGHLRHAAARRVEELVHVHELLVRLGHRPQDLGRHPRAAVDRRVAVPGKVGADSEQTGIDALLGSRTPQTRCVGDAADAEGAQESCDGAASDELTAAPDRLAAVRFFDSHDVLPSISRTNPEKLPGPYDGTREENAKPQGRKEIFLPCGFASLRLCVKTPPPLESS